VSGETQQNLRAAVVGAGHLGRIHARMYHQLSGVELAAVVDVREERARALAESFGAKPYKSVEEVPGPIHVVSVATNTSRHAEIALPLLRKGISVLVEKPIAESVADADAMIEAARASGATLTVGHSERFNPAVRAIEDTQLSPRFVEIHRLAPFSFRSQDVGVVLDLMIHDLDLLLRIVNSPVVAVDAVGGSLFTDSEDLANARLRFENGCVANVTASRASLEPMRRMRFFSSNGYVALDLQKGYALLVKKGPRFDAERGRLASLDPSSLPDPRAFVMTGLLDVKEIRAANTEEPLHAEIEGFLNASRGAGPNPCSGEEGRNALALAHRILAAMDRQSWTR
jgi:predicted dehydrogenase